MIAWGYNSHGQVTGIPGANSEIANPVTLGGQILSGVTAIAAGGYHTVALKNDGSVVGWGWNYYGQTPTPLAVQGKVTEIAAGGDHTVALVIPTAPNITAQPVNQAVNVWQSASFTVLATGYHLNYQWRKDGVDLAGETNDTYSLPFAQTNQAGRYTVVVSNPLGSVTSTPPAVLTVNPADAGTVVAWGNNSSVQTTVPVAAQSGVTAIAAGGFWFFRAYYPHTVALKDDGSVVAWGNIVSDQTTVPEEAQSGVTAIAAGYNHTVALKTDGSVVAWGGNDEGQTTIPLAAESGVTAIAAGYNYTVALKNDGSVVPWGRFDQTTVPVAARSGVTAIAAGSYHAVALKNDGSVVSWGSLDLSTVPEEAQSGVTAIAAGYNHTVALKNGGSVVAWGGNDYGQTTVPVAAQSGVTAIAAGWDYTLALKNDQTVVAWGSIGTASPVALEGQVLNGVTAIAAGPNHAVALIGRMQLLPSLKARPNGNDLILSWPTNAVGFTLQSTLDLTSPVTWIDSTNVPVVVGAHFSLTNSTSSGARFYRLRKM